MKRYEYIRLELDMGDLSELNRLSETGWRVVAVFDGRTFEHRGRIHYALLERELP